MRNATTALLAALIIAASAHTQSPAQATATGSARQLVEIAGYKFDPLNEKAPIPDTLRADSEASGLSWWIVQLHRPPTRHEREQLKGLALKLDRYLPTNAYLERIDAERLPQLRQQTLIRAAIPYQPAFKLSPTIGKIAFRTQERRALGFRLIAELFPEADGKRTAQELRDHGATAITFADRPNTRIEFNLPDAGYLPAIAHIDSIRWIEERPEVNEDP